MSILNFAEVHNMIAYLSKPTESTRFEQIIDFLNAHPIKYALTVNFTIYTLCVEQFWTTATIKNINGEAQLHAKVDGKKVFISEASIRRDLRFGDEGGIDCLPNKTIFEQLTLIGYEKLTQKLTFYKAFFSPQWKFLIHTIMQCLSAKTTTWNEFNSTIASAVICLATNQKFNFSKYIFDTMVKHLDSRNKFFMYPRKPKRQDPKKTQPSGPTTNVANEENVPTQSNDPPLSRVNTLGSGEDRLKLNELMKLCTKMSERVLNLETTNTNQAKEISRLKKRVKRLEKKKKSRTHALKRLHKVGLSARVESSDEESLGEGDASKHRKKIADIDADKGLTLIDETIED
uniref:Synaptobrevin, longin-like domain protein n=1 Tax=Tanacetum cinerariifolium TaxID=118510 RepID=A0A6L2L0N4_TANCI|nr:hypothetical protein [Tanacetum cinerariifolium]